MTQEPATLTYLIPEPFESALKSLRQALNREGVGCDREFDLSSQLKKDLGISLPPCKLLLAYEPYALLEAATVDSAGMVFLPAHVVISGRGPYSLVHIYSPHMIQRAGIPATVRSPLRKLFVKLLRALEKTGSRQTVCEYVA